MKDFFTSHKVSGIVVVLGSILVILLIFQAGIVVGYHEGAFTHAWSDDYYRGSNDPRSLLAPFMHGGSDGNPHGAAGQILSVQLPELMIKNPDSSEQVVIVSATTTIRILHDSATSTELKAGEGVIVIGMPDESGRIQASFIRIIPKP
jgi:hypothetical protein